MESLGPTQSLQVVRMRGPLRGYRDFWAHLKTQMEDLRTTDNVVLKPSWQLPKEDRPGPGGYHVTIHCGTLDFRAKLIGEPGSGRRVVGMWCHATSSA